GGPRRAARSRDRGARRARARGTPPGSPRCRSRRGARRASADLPRRGERGRGDAGLLVLAERRPRALPELGRERRGPRTGARLDVALGAALGERAHAADEALPLGDADRAARVEEVEGVRALHAVVVGRKDEPGGQQPLALLLEAVEEAEVELGVRLLEAE